MPLISVSDELLKKSFTSVENKFITKYLPVLEPNAVKVYLFALYAYQNGLNSLTLDDIAARLTFTSEQTESYFEYLEELELAAIISRSPFSVKILDADNVYGAPKKINPEKYADFAKGAQSVITGRMISTNEYREYYRLLEDYGFEQNALLMIMNYCVGLKGDNINMRYIKTVAKSFAAEGAITARKVDEKLADYDSVSLSLGVLFEKLHISGKPDLDDKKYYKQWTENLGFDDEAIKAAAKCFKVKSMDKLNDAVNELYRNHKLDVKEIQDYCKNRTDAINAAYDIAKKLGVFIQQPLTYVEKYVGVWRDYGYDFESLNLIADYCFGQDKKSFDAMNETILEFYNAGVINGSSLEKHIEALNEKDKFIHKLLKTCGLTRRIIENDRETVSRWRDWNFSDEMLLCAAEAANGKANPVAYMNTVLSAWKSENVFSPDKISKPAGKNKYLPSDSRVERAEIERHYYDLKHSAEDAAEKALIKAKADAVYGEIYDKINTLTIQLAFAEVKDANQAAKLSATLKELELQGDKRLKELGMDKSQFIPEYHCKKCNDTGYDKDGKPCECMKQFIKTLQ